MEEDFHKIVTWYRQHARPFLEQHRPKEKLEEYDRDCARLEQAASTLGKDLSACFLGNSGVGKSTLINALVADGTSVVPSGGVGPLTAQALTVRFGTEPRLEAVYHGPKQLWQLVFGLQSAWKTELGTSEAPDDTPIDATDDEPVLVDAEDVETTGDESARERDRMAARAVAALLVKGESTTDASIHYLVDSLRETLGYQRLYGTTADPVDAERLERIRKALALGRVNRPHTVEGTVEQLRPELKDHACGFLAPLIKTLTIWWNSPLLEQGVSLVDLPGLGVVGDPRPEFTRNFIRSKAQAVVLVVDNRGITEPVAELLRGSEFISRLLHGSDDPESNPVLIVVVTRVDDIAKSEYLSDGDREFDEHFESVCARTVPMVRQQLEVVLQSHWQHEGELTEAKQQVIRNLLETLQVHPVSAVEYRQLAARRRGAMLVDQDQTNIPALINGLQKIREQRETQKLEQLRASTESLGNGVLASMKLVIAEWTDENRRQEEIDQLRADLDAFMKPLRDEFLIRQGQYREFLKETIPTRITDLVKTAREQARNQIGKYLGRLGQAHWATLRASVRRGGRYCGATDIDLQRQFALSFETPIAEAWGQQILKDIRTRTNRYSADCVSLVEQVAEWAAAQGSRVQQQIVEAQKEAIRADANRLKTVGKEMIQEVREKNATALIDAIDGPIRNRCKRFVDAHQDVGGGVRLRILELYEKLADDVTEAAEQPSVKILRKLFREVEREIIDAFEQHSDPLQAMAEAIVTSQDKYIQRRDAQKRKKVLEQATAVLQAADFWREKAETAGA